MTYMATIVNDCMRQHFVQMEQVKQMRGKMTTNASGFGLAGRNADLQILPLEAPEYLGYLGLLLSAVVIGLAL